jgi:hypothetical protein
MIKTRGTQKQEEKLPSKTNNAKNLSKTKQKEMN